MRSGRRRRLPTSSASLRLLFFDAPVLELFVRDVFILQVTGFFTHIRSGAIARAKLRQRAGVDPI
jgi:hypothetical protein